jgi:hypothetical protein
LQRNSRRAIVRAREARPTGEMPGANGIYRITLYNRRFGTEF